MTSKSSIAAEALLSLQTGGMYNGIWLSDETVTREINKTYSAIKKTGGISRTDLNRATGPRGVGTLKQCGIFGKDNKTGIFRYEAHHIYCIHEEKDRSRVYYYYIDKPGEFPSITQPTNVDFPEISSDHRFALDIETRSQKRSRTETEVAGGTVGIDCSIGNRELSINDEIIANVRRTSSQRTGELEPMNNEIEILSSNDVKTFWWSTNAWKIFFGSVKSKDRFDTDDCMVAVKRRMKLLSSVINEPFGYKDVVEGYDKNNELTCRDVLNIRKKATVLYNAYHLAVDLLNVWTWEKCCNEAVENLEEVGIKIHSGRTVQRWNQEFRENGLFNTSATKKKEDPPLFHLYPEIKEATIKYCHENLGDMSVERVHKELVDNIIPSVADEENIEKENDATATLDNLEVDIDGEVGVDETNQQHKQPYQRQRQKTIGHSVLQSYVNRAPSLATVWRWLKTCGFKYDVEKKTFFVDGHERKENRKHRFTFCTKYLKKMELQMFRWIQISKDTAEKLVEENKIPAKLKPAHKYYNNETGEDMYEYHVDDEDYFSEYGNTHYDFGGNWSVRRDRNKKPLICIGQDECVFHQYYRHGRQWVGVNQQRALLPKSQGASVMISAFQSREFGFGLQITNEELNRVNEYRNGKKYADEDAAKEVKRNIYKNNLTCSPFVEYFQFRKDNYWDYNHMALQLEDCVDCLKVLYPEYDFIFLLDHSSGHAKKRVNGLDAGTDAMNIGYGGEQSKQRPTLIESIDGYCGPYWNEDVPNHVVIGQEQQLVFPDINNLNENDGPFEMSVEQRIASRFDMYEDIPLNDQKEVEKTKQELMDEFIDANINMRTHMINKYKLKDLQDIANQQIPPIPVKKKITKKLKVKGWVGKPKGMRQILWERGWIDENNIEKYKKIVVDEDGEIDDEFSLSLLMKTCYDFQNEITEIECMAQKLGVRVMCTTKYHAEIAGEGVEYSWGVSKSMFRKIRISTKMDSGREEFISNVKSVLSTDAKLNLTNIRRFSRRARSYMLVYYALGKVEQRQENDDNINNNDEHDIILLPKMATYLQIQKMVKSLQCHRNIVDLDTGFVNRIAQEDDMD